jgi:hypothetical protein
MGNEKEPRRRLFYQVRVKLDFNLFYGKGTGIPPLLIALFWLKLNFKHAFFSPPSPILDQAVRKKIPPNIRRNLFANNALSRLGLFAAGNCVFRITSLDPQMTGDWCFSHRTPFAWPLPCVAIPGWRVDARWCNRPVRKRWECHRNWCQVVPRSIPPM